MALVIDRAAEDAVFAELEELGLPLTAISEERGRVRDRGRRAGARGDRPGRRVAERQARAAVRVPVDRGGVGPGDGRRDVRLRGRAGGAARVVGAARASGAYARRRAARPRSSPARSSCWDRDRAAASWSPRRRLRSAALEAERVRALGSVAATLCLVADGRLDAHAQPAPDPVGGRRGRPADRARGGRRGGLPRGRRRAPRRSALDMRSRVVGRPRARRLVERLLASSRDYGARPRGQGGLRGTTEASRLLRPRHRAAAGAARGSSTSTSRAAGSPSRRVIERIRELAIPPAWEDVWICPWPMGHIQATGHRRRRPQAVPLPRPLARAARPREVRRDDRLRPRAAADAPAGAARPGARRACRRERALACAARLMDRGFFRIGSRGLRRGERHLRHRDDAQAPRDGGRTTW